MYRLCLLFTAALLLVACSKESEVPQAVAVAVTAPQDNADKEVLVASNPSGAKLVLKGAEVGTTPMKLLVRGDTNVVLEKEGYVKQAVLITPKSDPNMVVNLVAMPASEEDTEVQEEEVAADEDVQEKESASKSKKKTKKSSGKKADKEESQAAADTEEGPSEVVSTPAPKKTQQPKKKTYTTMAQLKRDYRDGKITKAEYRKHQAEIRRKRAVELEAARQAYEEGKLTKTQYKQKVRSIKLKYEG